VGHGQDIEGVLPNGLIIGHAYSVTSVKQVSLQLLENLHNTCIL